MSPWHLPPEQRIRQRWMWFQEAQRLGNVTVACRRLGISRQSFYKWRRRLQTARGAKHALLDRSRRPHRSPRRIGKALTRRICQLRKRTRLGPRRLWWLLKRQPGLRPVPSPGGIYRVLRRAGLLRRRRPRRRYRGRFVVPRPGDCVQVDIKWVPYPLEGRQLYQYTAIDCCTRLRVVQFHEELAVHAAKAFAQYCLSTFPFPVRVVQTDNDAVFTHWYTAAARTPLDRPLRTHPFTVMCASLGASHRLIPPRTPRLNGRVERSHQTDEQEFYRRPPYRTRVQLERAFRRWLWQYNHLRPHDALGGRTPFEALRAFSEYTAIPQLKG